MTATHATTLQAEMNTLIKARTDAELLLMHPLATETYRRVGPPDSDAALLVLNEIEAELDRRGFTFCDACGCANDTHDPAWH